MSYFYKIFKTLAYICLPIILFSCKKEISYQGLNGELKGHVTLYEYAGTPSRDNSNMLVTVEGTSPVLQTTTNETGDYAFKDLKTGIYDLVFTKEGFGTYKIISYQFIGGNVPSVISPLVFGKLPVIGITDFKVDTGRYDFHNCYVTVTGTTTVSTYVNFRYYVSDSPDVSFTNYQATDYFSFFSSGSKSINLSASFLSKLTRGKQLYMIAYPTSPSSMSYIDMNTGKQIYMINSSLATTVIPFMIPNTLPY